MTSLLPLQLCSSWALTASRHLSCTPIVQTLTCAICLVYLAVVLELGPGGRQLFPDFNPPAEQLRAQLLSQAPVATPAKRKSSGGRSTGKSKGKQKRARRGAHMTDDEEEEQEEQEEEDSDPDEVQPHKRGGGGGRGGGKGSGRRGGGSGGNGSGSGKGKAKGSAGKRSRSPPPPGWDDGEAGPSLQRGRAQQPPAALHASQHNHRQQPGGLGSPDGGGSGRGAGPSQHANGWAHGGGGDSDDDFQVGLQKGVWSWGSVLHGKMLVCAAVQGIAWGPPHHAAVNPALVPSK